jgi:hypothetical protein
MKRPDAVVPADLKIGDTADCKSALRGSNPRGVELPGDLELADDLPNAIRRYGRLQICVTNAGD